MATRAARPISCDPCGLTATKTYGYFFGVVAPNATTGTAMDPLGDTSRALRDAACADQRFVIGLQMALPVLLTGFGWTALAWYAVCGCCPA